MVRAVTNLKSRGKTTFLCLSNANSVFISTVLKVNNYSCLAIRSNVTAALGKRLGYFIRRDHNEPSWMGCLGIITGTTQGGPWRTSAQLQDRMQSELVQRWVEYWLGVHRCWGCQRWWTGIVPFSTWTCVWPNGLCWRWIQRLLPSPPPQKVILPLRSSRVLTIL